MLKTQKQIKVNIFVSFVFALALFCLPKFAEAATIYFSPAAGSFKTGDLINISVRVNTQEQAINNTDGTIYFPADTLEVISVSKSGSIFSLWVEEPNFSNSAGSISFNGGVPTPGFTGSSGKVLGIVFRAKKAGTASVSFASASIRANDGYGTNILTGSGQAQFDISGTQTAAPDEPAPAEEPQNRTVSSAISSNTHPDPNKWYSNSDPRFTWSLPLGTTAVRILYSENPNSQPSVVYQPAISSKALAGVEDGVWYFHLQLKNANGWGPVSHFRFQIDTTKPKNFKIQIADDRDATDPIVRFIFSIAEASVTGDKDFIFTAKDEISGIDHFSITIDNSEEQVWQAKSGDVYNTPVLTVGEHTLFVKVFDQAGNYLADSISFEVKPPASPVITYYPTELVAGDEFLVRGKTTTNSQVIIYLEKEGEPAIIETVNSDADGNFVVHLKNGLKKGLYSLWASATDSRGAQSADSAKLSITVKQSDLARVGTRAINVLSIVIILVALVIALALLSLFGWRKVLLFKSKLKKETREAESKLHEMFNILRNDIQQQIKIIQRGSHHRVLSMAEKRVIKKLQESLDKTELAVEKEISDIEKI